MQYEEFQNDLKNDKTTALNMISNIADREYAAYLSSKSPIKYIGSMGEASASVKHVIQAKTWWCGYATTLQTLYGLNLESKVSGAGDDAKQTTIANEMGHPSSSAVVYEIRDYLNKNLTYSKYAYYEGSGMTLSSFTNKTAYSLMIGRPVILHAKTASLSYYNGKNLAHYLSLDYLNQYNSTVRIVDCNYDSTYTGSHYVPISEAFGTVNISGRYVIEY